MEIRIGTLTGNKSWNNIIGIIEARHGKNEYSTICFDDDRFHDAEAMGFVSVSATTTTAYPGK